MEEYNNYVKFRDAVYARDTVDGPLYNQVNGKYYAKVVYEDNNYYDGYGHRRGMQKVKHVEIYLVDNNFKEREIKLANKERDLGYRIDEQKRRYKDLNEVIELIKNLSVHQFKKLKKGKYEELFKDLV